MNRLTVRKSIGLASFWGACICLAAGYALAGEWTYLAGVLGLVGIRIAISFMRDPADWVKSILFCGIVALSAAGLLVGLSPYLMILAVIAGLVSWDLAIPSPLPVDEAHRVLAERCEIQHLRSLLAAIGIGWVLAVIGINLRLPLPFGWMVVLLCIAIFCLDRALRISGNAV